MIDDFGNDAAFSMLKRSPFGDVDANDVFDQRSSISTTPTSAIEDLGFTPEQLAFIRNGIYNGDFRTPPPEGAGVELDDNTNKLPGWSYVKTGTAVTATWENDGDGGNVTFAVAAGAATTDSAYLEQIIPVSAIGLRRIVKLVTATATTAGIAESDTSIIAQYLDEDGATTGSSDQKWTISESGDIDMWTACPNGEAGVPTDGYYLRVRIQCEDIGSTADTVVIKDVVIEERLSPAGDIAIYPLTGNSNSFSAGGLMKGAQIVSIAPDANHEIRGINATGVPLGRILWLHNEDTTNTITLIHDSGSASSASYRIVCPNNSDLTIRPRGTVMLCYFAGSGGVSRWRVMSQV